MKTSSVVLGCLVLLALLFSGPPLAQNKVIVVPLFDSGPTGIAAIPVYCLEAITSPGELEVPNCRRADTREPVTPVPQGHFLLLTDILTNRNNLATSGRAFIYVGVNDGVSVPSLPRFDFSLRDLSQSEQFHWSVPYLILQPGEEIGVYNSSSSDQAVDIYITGYLVETDGFGR
jgi:hypothetical protein